MHAHSFLCRGARACLWTQKGWWDVLVGDTNHCETKLCTQRCAGFLALLPGEQTEAGFVSPLELWGKKRNLNVSIVRKDCAFCGSVGAISQGPCYSVGEGGRPNGRKWKDIEGPCGSSGEHCTRTGQTRKTYSLSTICQTQHCGGHRHAGYGWQQKAALSEHGEEPAKSLSIQNILFTFRFSDGLEVAWVLAICTG